ncbi:MAG: terpene cyclase/mutase family protein [Anaerolineae bacterium]|nr:terpene cyclase/mutase family protein [Anaerolineae bacterium]
MKRAGMLIVIVIVILALALPVFAQDDPTPSAQAVAYLLTMQNEDGGFTNGWAPESDLVTTADVVIAAVAAGENPEAFFAGDMMNPFGFLGMQLADGNVAGAGQLAKVAIAVAAAGKDVDDFSGHDLVADLLAMQGEDGTFGFGAFDHCLTVIALQNAGIELPEGTVNALVGVQNEDGGWGFMAGEASDTNTTGLCLQALALTDAVDAAGAGFDYLAAIQNEDGGWPYQNPSDYGTDSDANSTALIVQALIANGYDLAEWDNPQDFLLALQNESGSFSFQLAMPGDNVLATVAVIPAIEGLPLNAWSPLLEAAE